MELLPVFLTVLKCEYEFDGDHQPHHCHLVEEYRRDTKKNHCEKQKEDTGQEQEQEQQEQEQNKSRLITAETQ